jgi:hypothetical protein
LTIGEFLEFAQDQYFAEGARHRTKNEANGLGFRFTQQQRFRGVLVRGYIKDDFFRTTIALGIYLQPQLSPSVHQPAVIAITYNRKDPSARISATISIKASISSKKCLLYDVLGRIGISAEETREIVGGVELGNDSFVKSGKGIILARRSFFTSDRNWSNAEAAGVNSRCQLLVVEAAGFLCLWPFFQAA